MVIALALSVELSARGKTPVYGELIPRSVLLVQHLQWSSVLISERTLQRGPHTDINLARRVTLLKSEKTDELVLTSEDFSGVDDTLLDLEVREFLSIPDPAAEEDYKLGSALGHDPLLLQQEKLDRPPSIKFPMVADLSRLQMTREIISIVNFLSTFGMASELYLNNLRLSRDQKGCSINSVKPRMGPLESRSCYNCSS